MVIRRGRGEFRTLKDKPIIQRKGRRDWKVVGPAPLLPGAKGGPWCQAGELAFDPQPGVEGGHRRVFEGAQYDYTCEEAAARCSTNVECRG